MCSSAGRTEHEIPHLRQAVDVMCNFMKALLFTIGLFFYSLYDIHAQDGNFQFNEIGWTISIPKNFKIQDSLRAVKEMRKGVRSIEKLMDTTDKDTETRMLFSANIGKFGMVSSTIKLHGDYVDSTNSLQILKNILFVTTTKLISKAIFDSISSSMIIDDVTFDKFEVNTVRKGKVVFSEVLLYTMYKGYDLCISYTYTDDKMKQEIETVLTNSHFIK